MKITRLLPTVLLASLILASCNSTTSTNNNPPTAADEVKAIVSADPSADPGNSGFDGTDAVLEGAQLLPGAAAPMGLRRALADTCWFRQVTSTSVTLTASGDTTALLVSLTRTNSGTLHVGGCPNPVSALDFDKSYAATWTRSATYAKSASVDPANGEENATTITRWRLVSSSLPRTVANSGDPVIDSVRIFALAGGSSRTYTDPVTQEDPATWPVFSVGDTVGVQVYAHGLGPIMSFMHFDVPSGAHSRLDRRRMPFDSFSASYKSAFKIRQGYFAGRPRGLRVRQSLWVDVLTRATLRDSAAPYNSTGWGIPYKLQHSASPGFAYQQ